jgi:cyclopropane-fatty-acyl-phospholipid synthase
VRGERVATREEIEATYNYMDEVWRLSLGENADITAAMYDGDFTKSLEQAQQDKHEYILKHIKFEPGSKVLDIGCGWGGFLKTVVEKKGHGIGLTLSSSQAYACRRSGLEVYLDDWKHIGADTYGRLNGVVSVGAFEHFCSEKEYLAGKQESIYQNFFNLCHELLPSSGRLFLQTMTWGKKVPDSEGISLQARRGSDEYILGVIRKFYPGSWLPAGMDQIARTAHPYFKIILTNNGRRDYIETISQWGKRLNQLSLVKVFAAMRMSKYLFTDKDFRYRLENIISSYNQECFRRKLMDHERIVLEKVEFPP